MVDVTALAQGPFLVFLAIFLGVLLGKVEFRGFSLGISGVMFVGLAIGALPLALPIEVGVDPGFQTLALVLFVAAIGLLAAEDIGGVIRAYGWKFVAIAVVMTAIAAGFTNFSIGLFSPTADPWVVRGAFNGAVTSSPGLASMLEVAPATAHAPLSAGYAFSYPIGVVAIILFAQLAPQLAELDLETERRRYATTVCQTRDVGPQGSVTFSLAGFSLTIVVGAIVGLIPIPLGPLGPVSLGLTGGTLLAALTVGHLRKVGPIATRMDRTVLTQIREVAIAIFLAVVGIEAAAAFVDAATTQALALLVSSLLISVGTMVIGFVLARVLWDLDWISTVGVITGGMTSTPGLGAAINSTGTEEVAAPYGATYPVALFAKVVFAKLLVAPTVLF